jgi:hypothetical protein
MSLLGTDWDYFTSIACSEATTSTSIIRDEQLVDSRAIAIAIAAIIVFCDSLVCQQQQQQPKQKQKQEEQAE